jgi:ABC-type glycerol-3-phosphate transport system substrate-binding protein
MNRIHRTPWLAPLLLGVALTAAMACSSNNNKSANNAAAAVATKAAATAAGAAATPAGSASVARATGTTASGSPAAAGTSAAAGGNVAVSPGVVNADKTLAAAAGAGSPIDSVTISKPVEINFWHVYSDGSAQGNKMAALVKDFQSKNPNITVNAQYVGSYDPLYQKIQTAIAGGQTPDVAVAYENQVADYQQANVIIPLDDYIKSQKYGLPKGDYADILSAYRYDNFFAAYKNQMLSFPFTKSVELMYYNADKLKAAGVDVPQTWDDFQKAAKAVTKGDVKGWAFGVDVSLFNGSIYSREGQLISDDEKKWLFNNQQGLDTLSQWQQMVKDGSAYQISKQFADQTDFGHQQAVFTFSSSAGIPFYEKEVKDDGTFNWGVALPPHGTGQGPSTVMYGANVTMFKSSPEKQLASWLFIKYFTSKEVNPDWSTATGYLPVRTSGLTDERVKTKAAASAPYNVALQNQQYGRPEPNVRQNQAIRNIIADTIVATISDTSKNVKQLLDQAVNQSNQEMTK